MSSGIAALSVPTGANGFDGFWQTQPPGELLNLLSNNQPIVDDVQIDDRQVWSAGIVAGYFDGNVLSLTSGQTDASGEGGFLNVPEGCVTITATLAATHQTIGSARLYSKVGAISSAILSPSP